MLFYTSPRFHAVVGTLFYLVLQEKENNIYMTVEHNKGWHFSMFTRGEIAAEHKKNSSTKE